MPLTARLRRHWPEYAAEALGLGLFMISASVFATLIEHPSSALRQGVSDPLMRRLLMGVAMGTTAVALIYSPLGAKSGGHFNPATTLTFFRLGHVHALDACAYAAAQFAGGLAGMLVASAALATWIAAPEVHFVATVPGPSGHVVALLAEIAIAFMLMTAVLHVSNSPRYSRYTGLLAGVLVAVYITVEAPVSGMSLNPARSLGPAFLAGELESLWIYFVAPVTGMLLAAEVYIRIAAGPVYCAKLHHHSRAGCIFQCRFHEMSAALAVTQAAGPPSAPAMDRPSQPVRREV